MSERKRIRVVSAEIQRNGTYLLAQRSERARRQAEVIATLNSRLLAQRSSSQSWLPPEDPFELLGIPRDASEDVIRAAVRRARAAIHPDRVASLGSELQSTFEVLSRRVSAAEDAALAQRTTRTTAGT